MKQITLCADDFAQSPAISAGILELVAANRLGAVSCMADSPIWPEMAKQLKAQHGSQQTGLHFDLTHSYSGSHLRVEHLMMDTLTGNVNPEMVRSRFIRQWEAFKTHYGQAPDFVDGHQHVHAFPQIRDIVVTETAKRNPDAWIRQPRSSAFSLKARVLQWMTNGLTACITDAGLTHNVDFSGCRPYRKDFDFGHFIRGVLKTCKDGTLVMCHPGMFADDDADPIANCRQNELDYLKSGQFLLDLAKHDITLGRAKVCRPSLHIG